MDYLSFLWIFYTWFLFPPLPPVHLQFHRTLFKKCKFAILQKYCIIHCIPYYGSIKSRSVSVCYLQSQRYYCLFSPGGKLFKKEVFLERGNNLFKHKVYEYNFWLIFNFSIGSCYMIEHETFKRIFIGRKK